LFLKQQPLEMVKVAPSLKGEDQAVDELLQEVWIEVGVCSDNVLY
jgi:hypothetical protein